jgi:TRAP-type C4-dicarboxylate transport system permease small subunit
MAEDGGGPSRPSTEAIGAAVDGLPVADSAGLGGETNPELLPAPGPLRTIMHLVGQVEQAIGAVLLVIILVLVLAQVAQRYLPGGYPWTGELARYSMVWATFVLAGYLAAHDRHIAIHVVDFVLHGRALAAVKLMVNVFVLITCLVLLYGTYVLITEDIGQVTAAAEIPLRWVNAVPLIGFSMTAIRALLGIWVNDVPALLGRAEVAS